MGEDVRQWLEQIRQLQNQLSQLRQECDRAYESAANWQRLYETEAQQRRYEAHMAREKLQALEEQIQTRHRSPWQGGGEEVAETVAEEVAQWEGEAMREKWVALIQERDRLKQTVATLSQALQTEQSQHHQTRQSLTAALGDAIDQLNRERRSHHRSQSTD